jgi:glycosyltransferase involved in cell wall biosynthesis
VGKAKGSFDLLEAAREVRSRGVDASFDLVGDELTSGEYEQLRKRVDESGLNGHVRLHAAAYGSDKIAFLRKADVFVYPSYHEGMPIAVLEAMACGLPVVATRVGGLPDLVTDGANGLLVEPGKPDQLATALQKIFLENGLRRPMQRKSREIAFERYDIEQRVAQLVDIYKAALSEG